MQYVGILQAMREKKKIWGAQFLHLCFTPLHGVLIIFFLQTVHHNAYHEDPYAKEFGIKISERLAQVEARILPAPWVSIFICVATF